MAIMQEKILPAEVRDARRFEEAIGKILVGRQRGRSRGVLRKERAAAGAKAMAGGCRHDAENQPRSAIQLFERQPEFGAGVFRIDGLIGIVAWLSFPKHLKVSHETPAILKMPRYTGGADRLKACRMAPGPVA